jgi:hypothetical protein
MVLKFSGLVVIGILGMSHPALAADCDQTQSPPRPASRSLQYTGSSKIRVPQNNVTSWQCFFMNSGQVLDVSAKLVDASGSYVKNFATSEVNINRTYYLGQTVVTVDFQQLSDKPPDLYVNYTVSFGQDEPVGIGTVACGPTHECVEVKSNGDWRVGNPRNPAEASGNLYAGGTTRAHSFTAGCSESEWCVVIDDEGHRWQGSIRHYGSPSDFPTGP